MSGPDSSINCGRRQSSDSSNLTLFWRQKHATVQEMAMFTVHLVIKETRKLGTMTLYGIQYEVHGTHLVV